MMHLRFACSPESNGEGSGSVLSPEAAVGGPELFETVDTPMITRDVLLKRLNAEGYGQHAASFVDARSEAQFEARLADIKRVISILQCSNGELCLPATWPTP
jgi:hypothetical protein